MRVLVCVYDFFFYSCPQIFIVDVASVFFLIGESCLQCCCKSCLQRFAIQHEFYFIYLFACWSLFIFIYLFIFYFTILYWFCHTSTWIRHGCTRVPHPESPSFLPPHTIPLGHPSAPGASILYHASNLDWRFNSHMISYMFQCHSPKSSHPCPLPQSPKDCSIHLCLSCCLTYRVIITIFLNSLYMC